MSKFTFTNNTNTNTNTATQQLSNTNTNTNTTAWLHHGMRPVNLCERCTGCGTGFSVEYRLSCKNGLFCVSALIIQKMKLASWLS